MIAATQAYWKVFAFLYGRMVPFHPPDEVTALYKRLSPSEQEYFEITRESGIYGTPMNVWSVCNSFAVNTVPMSWVL